MSDSSTQNFPPASPPPQPSFSRNASKPPNALVTDCQTNTTPLKLPTPPFHSLSSLPNFRDIGGWPIISSTTPKHVRTDLIFRGPDITHISPEDIASLQTLNISTDYDLRSAGQITKLGCRDLSEYGIRRVWCPVYSDEDGKSEEEAVRRRYEQYASDDVSVSSRPLSSLACHQTNADHTIIGHRCSIHVNTDVRRTRPSNNLAGSAVLVSSICSVHTLHDWK
ncbi:hypothetical protein IQ06DRAFT_132578 [Phaeosphaeriaceae sp. SRC1lsM3a]|nr:hypothetical protein IQ06DRAFT_132578 [Stagonospora sp. SRC1lsM3a]